MACEYWMHGFPVPGQVVELAVQAESWGLDGLLLADSEMLVVTSSSCRRPGMPTRPW